MATKEFITRGLEQVKLNRYGGASIVDAGSSNYTVADKTRVGPVFMNAQWMQLYEHAVKEAERLEPRYTNHYTGICAEKDRLFRNKNIGAGNTLTR